MRMRALYKRVAGQDASLSSLVMAPMRWVFGNRRRVRVHGRPFTIDLRDEEVSFRILLLGEWEPNETALFRTLIKPGDRVIDLGAHIGYFSLLFGSLVGTEGRVIGIEPDPENAALARLNIAENGMERFVRILEAAGGARQGRATLYRLTVGDRGDQRMFDAKGGQLHRRGRVREAVDVSVVTVDDCARDLDRVDVIKMDVQGCERQVLEGMSETLDRNPGLVLVTEFAPAHLEAAGEKPNDLLAFLRQRGFSTWFIGTAGKPQRADFAEVVKRAAQARCINLLCAREERVAALFT
jgi:FkbM family methyltransferase